MIDEALHAEKHRHARLQLQQIERLGEEIVGAGGEAGDPRVEIGHRGQDHDGDDLKPSDEDPRWAGSGHGYSPRTL